MRLKDRRASTTLHARSHATPRRSAGRGGTDGCSQVQNIAFEGSNAPQPLEKGDFGPRERVPPLPRGEAPASRLPALRVLQRHGDRRGARGKGVVGSDSAASRPPSLPVWVPSSAVSLRPWPVSSRSWLVPRGDPVPSGLPGLHVARNARRPARLVPSIFVDAPSGGARTIGRTGR